MTLVRALAVVAVLLGSAWAARAQHTGHEHGQKPPEAQKEAVLPPFIAPVTDADRAAAFPDVEGHTVHDDHVNVFALADQLEWQTGQGASGFVWNGRGWVGKDRDRFWFRSEGESADGRLESAEVHLLYGRAISPWWDVVAGVRQDIRPGDPQTWAAFGVQGLAPYWFDVEATAYLGGSARTRFTFETEYEVLLTNRLVLQPLLELDVHGKADPERGVGAGLGEIETGLRLRYEIQREVAPYVGVLWRRKTFGTADLARQAGERVSDARLAVGLRLWY
jgi:copper resistance protein B